MSNTAERKPFYSDPLLILISSLLLVALIATLYFAGSRPAHEFSKEPAVRPRPIITNDTRVVIVSQSGSKSGAGAHGAKVEAGHAEESKAESKPVAEAKPAEPKASTGVGHRAAKAAGVRTRGTPLVGVRTSGAPLVDPPAPQSGVQHRLITLRQICRDLTRT